MPAGESEYWESDLRIKLLQESWDSDFQPIVEKLKVGTPLDRDDCRFLFNQPDLDTIGKLANIVKQSRFGKSAFFNVNVHINQTNLCTLACKFCAFRRGRKAKDAYAMEIEEYIEDLRLSLIHI